MKIVSIYKIENKVNGRIYVGGSSETKDRIRNHFCLLKNNKHHSCKLQADFNTYGKDAFKAEIIESLYDKKNLREREQYWIDRLLAYSVGYNMQPNAKTSKGMIHTEESKKNMSISKKGKPQSESHKANRIASLRGYKQTPEHKEKIRLAKLAKKLVLASIHPLLASIQSQKFGQFLGSPTTQT